MFALRIIKHRGVVEDILSGVVAGFVCFASDALALQQVENLSATALSPASSARAGSAVSAAAHAVFEIVLLQE